MAAARPLHPTPLLPADGDAKLITITIPELGAAALDAGDEIVHSDARPLPPSRVARGANTAGHAHNSERYLSVPPYTLHFNPPAQPMTRIARAIFLVSVLLLATVATK